MAKDKALPDVMHFASLDVENVRAFARHQTLQLSNEDGTPNHWCLILGENGVGKTTLLQALALMRPVPAIERKKSSLDAGVPSHSEPEMAGRQNDEIERFVRQGTTGPTAINATLVDLQGKRLQVSAKVTSIAGEIENVDFPLADYPLRSDGPLIISYGAARHVGHGNKSMVAQREASWSLFSDAVDLYDAEELLEELEHAAKAGPKELRKRDRERLRAIYRAIASLLEEKKPGDIEFRGPRVPGRKASQCGIHVTMPSGQVPLAELSLGYQAMFAWTVDLAYRLMQAYPESRAPLTESAIVLVDEIDLHLHPRWQRDLRRHLLGHFPNVQFIATTHSPVTAQDALAEGGLVSVVRWKSTASEILKNPMPSRDWRVDQLLTSELFDFGVPRSRAAEVKMKRRAELVQQKNLDAGEQRELAALDAFVNTLPTARTAAESDFEELMSGFRNDFQGPAAR